MAAHPQQNSESLGFEYLKKREAQHISLDFGAEVTAQALAILNDGADHERQYYDLLALARRHAEPLEIAECEPGHSEAKKIGRIRRAMRRIDGMIEHTSQELVEVPTKTFAVAGFIFLDGVAITASDILATSPVALTGYVATACMYTSFIRQLQRQERLM